MKFCSIIAFKNQFIGNYSNFVTSEEELKRNYCNNYWCTNDAHYLFTKSSQYPNVNPCVDFKNFTVNQIDEVDVPDDRQWFRGFMTIVENKFLERKRKIVAAKFDPNKDENNRVIKIVKNTFSQCLKSKHALRHIQAHKDIVEHLQSLGGSSFLSKHIYFNRDKFNEATDFGIEDLWTNNVPENFNEDELWTGGNFNINKFFEVEPYHALSLFFDYEIKRCDNDKICFKRSNLWNYIEDDYFEVFYEFLRTLDDAFRMGPKMKKILINDVYKPSVRRVQEFMKIRGIILDKHRNKGKTKIIIKSLQFKFSGKLEIDWLKIINSQLFEESKLTENDEIIIDGGIDLLEKLVKILIEMDKKAITDNFVITFLYWNRFYIILRFHNEQTLFLNGYKHGWQRWQTCIYQNTLDTTMQPALLVMYEKYRSIWDRTLGDFDRDLTDERIDIIGSAENLIQEAVDEFKRRFLANTAPFIPIEVATDVLFKLKNLKILISLPKSIFPISKLEEFYKNLNLTGKENFMKSLWEIQKHHRKLRNEPKSSWRRQIDQIVEIYPKFVKYNIEDGNVLYFSPFEIIYPWYHPLRPRFFNMATLFKSTVTRLYFDIKEFIIKKYKINVILNSEGDEQIAYENYKNWLKNHKDLQIGANYLTNEQLFWIASAVSNFNKYHKTVPKSTNERNRLNHEYMHVRYKFFKGFQEAFQCNITENELKIYLEFVEKYLEFDVN
ncbi:hypothetical protein PVAND_015481 [Polypedilum vanderplanki]|uniref:Uncharacterized protein n=1 Tax=Polypedilum vanderplanki TaxID=319348 RepID=A0A9J6BD70_POLVA|nr:hypothetical protein PVAND_015481 [Polypedilum vanderplanki]